ALRLWALRDLNPLIVAVALVLEDQPAHLEIKLLGIGQEVYRLQRLLLAGRLDDELAVSEYPAPGRPLEAHIGHFGERHHIDGPGENAGGEKQPLGRYYEVVLKPVPDLEQQPEHEKGPDPPDDQQRGAVAMGHRGGKQAG